MNYLLSKFNFMPVLFATLFAVACADTSDKAAPSLEKAVFLVGTTATTLNLINYATRDSANAVAVVDSTVTPNTVSATGTVVFSFWQLLDGLSIQKRIPLTQQIDGVAVDVKVGRGDYENQLPVLTGFTPIKEIVSLVSATQTDYSVSYRPDGGLQINGSDRIDQNPKPAVVLSPRPGTAFMPGIVIIHLIAETGIKNTDGKAMAPALSKNNEPIVLPDGRKVAATVVLKI